MPEPAPAPLGADGLALAQAIGEAPRPAGSAAEAAARAVLRARLVALGFTVAEQSFEYSAFPGRWGTSVIGTWLALAAFGGVGGVLGGAGDRSVAIALVGTLLAAGAAWWLERWGTRTFGACRRSGTNLEARRGVPAVWLVAHLDSKSQPVSLALRAGGVVVCVVGWLIALAAWGVARMVSAPPGEFVVLGLLAAGVGALPLAGSLVGANSPGALDNASGVVTIFEAVTRLPPDAAVGVLVTTAEELALAGARAWSDVMPPGRAINCDGVDDTGEIVCVVARDRSGVLRRAIGLACARKEGCRTRRSIPGVLFDSVALADAGWDVMTVTRGRLSSLGRVHTSRDTLALWTGRGVPETATFVAGVAGAMIAEQGNDHPAEREE